MNGPRQAYWLEQTEADVPAVNEWLSAEERARLADLRFHKRWTEWRLGRWTAKRAVAWWLNLPGVFTLSKMWRYTPHPRGLPKSSSSTIGRPLAFLSATAAAKRYVSLRALGRVWVVTWNLLKLGTILL